MQLLGKYLHSLSRPLHLAPPNVNTFLVKISCVFQSPALYFGQISYPENNLPNPGKAKEILDTL